ncbi:MAG: tetratricopeptide repeat protein, partial [Planctomycetaceae bacterium]
MRSLTTQIGVVCLCLVMIESVRSEDDKQHPLLLGEAVKRALATEARVQFLKPDGSRGSYARSVFPLGSKFKTLQIAFVVDGTNSMLGDVENLKKLLQQIVAVAKVQTGARKAEVAFVIYRDLYEGPDSQPRKREQPIVVLALDRYSSDKHSFLDLPAQRQTVETHLKKLNVGTGLPGPQEQVDWGIHEALDKLNWTVDEEVGRIVFVAGDAPPWNMKWHTSDPDWKSHYDKLGFHGDKRLRQFSTQSLVDLANKKQVKIFSVMCAGSSHQDSMLRAELETFFTRLASGTGGRYLNPRDERTADRLMQRIRPEQLQDVGVITVADLQTRQTQKPVRIGIMPAQLVSDLEERSFRFTATQHYQHALRIFHLLQSQDARSVRNCLATRKAWKELSSVDGWIKRPEKDKLADLIQKLDVDVMVSVDGQPDAGEPGLALGFHAIDVESVSIQVAAAELEQGLVQVLDRDGRGLDLRNLAQQLGSLTQFVSYGQQAAPSLLIQALDNLERATEFEYGSPDNRRLSIEAIKQLDQVLNNAPENAWARLLLANAQYNLENDERFRAELQRAFDHRQTTKPLIRMEIEADHALFVRQRPQAALSSYRAIIEQAPTWSKEALRAKWMLAGILLGDYGFRKTTAVQLGYPDDAGRIQAARNHVIDILF